MSYGFEKATKRSVTTTAEAEPRKLDLTGLGPSTPIEISPAQEQAAVAAGERLGFVAREASTPPPPSESAAIETVAPSPVARARQTAPIKSILIKGPESVINRFIAYTNERQARSYWEILDEFLKGKGK